ncbi:MAG: hypothetical protein KC964_29390, partial [Candidatus Omnitrophica bacterium]|nr:hypothetical protein [Candidatus Omnitrophota bacterium]
ERYRDVPATDLPLPPEQIGTRARLRNWTENMLQWHGYSNAEAAGVAGLSEPQFKREVDNLAWSLEENSLKKEGKILALPYPGG